MSASSAKTAPGAPTRWSDPLPSTPDYYATGAEALVVGLAQTGDRDAFSELVRRRQSWIRNLMRRFSGDASLADDLAQQVFLQAWRKLGSLRDRHRFGPWLKRMAVNTWLQYLRKSDALKDADAFEGDEGAHRDTPGVALDLDGALATLPAHARLCIVLSYNEGMTHPEIAAATGLPAGTVKSHIRRGTGRLQELLSAYAEDAGAEVTP